MSIIYHVANWNEFYENNRSRRVKDLDWVPVPNKHDGEKYTRLMMMENASVIFAAWILILEVASKCQPRGSLVRQDGSSHGAESLSIKTRAPMAWFECALPVLTEIGWLDTEIHEQGELPLGGHDSATVVSPKCHHGGYEGKGREGKRREEKGGAKAPRTRILPKVDEWLAYGRHYEPTWPEADARMSFDHYEANGWKQNRGAVIQNWQAALRTCVGFWRQRNPGRSISHGPREADVIPSNVQEILDLRAKHEHRPDTAEQH